MTPPVSRGRAPTREPADRERDALARIDRVRAAPPRFRDDHITMAHGAGGRATATLIEGLLLPAFASAPLESLGDAAFLRLGGADLAITTDSFVVKPLRFPGGSIGELAVNGSVNDLAVSAARPVVLTVSFVLEEGLSSELLRQEVDAIARAASAAGVSIVGGDTKVVERGHADGMYVTTTGLGVRDPRAQVSPAFAHAGDRIIVSGPIGAHGMAIMTARGEFELDADIRSDTHSLWPAVDALLDAVGPSVRCMRDATRGGVASVLNELAAASRVAMQVEEARVPLDPAVAGACELLGIDPMYVANEGVFVAVVAPEAVESAVDALRAMPGAREAAVIGEVQPGPSGMVLVQTAFGGRRVMDLLVGDPLPRIC